MLLDSYLLSRNEQDASDSRPDNSQRQQRQLPPCPLVIALMPLKCYSIHVQFLIGCPLPWRKCLGALAPLKNVFDKVLMEVRIIASATVRKFKARLVQLLLHAFLMLESEKSLRDN